MVVTDYLLTGMILQLGYYNWSVQGIFVGFFVKLFAKNIWRVLSSSHKIMVQWKMGGGISNMSFILFWLGFPLNHGRKGAA